MNNNSKTNMYANPLNPFPNRNKPNKQIILPIVDTKNYPKNYGTMKKN